jgi:hypothetical protein
MRAALGCRHGNKHADDKRELTTNDGERRQTRGEILFSGANVRIASLGGTTMIFRHGSYLSAVGALNDFYRGAKSRSDGGDHLT